ncbi:uncharacterized protein LOC144580195 [Callithrix jacchus]
MRSRRLGDSTLGRLGGPVSSEGCGPGSAPVNKQKPPPTPGASRGRASRAAAEAEGIGPPGRGRGRAGGLPGRRGADRHRVVGARRRQRPQGGRVHSPVWRNCSSSSFPAGAGRLAEGRPRVGASAAPRGLLPRGRASELPRRRRSSLAPSRSRTLPFFVAPVSLKAGLPRTRTHTHARSPPLGALHPGAHAARAPERAPATRPPGPARPLPRPGALWASQPAPRSSIRGPLTLRVQNKGRIAEPQLGRSPRPPAFVSDSRRGKKAAPKRPETAPRGTGTLAPAAARATRGARETRPPAAPGHSGRARWIMERPADS